MELFCSTVIPQHVLSVVEVLMFVLAVLLHGRQVEWTARLDFLWQIQANEEKREMDALQHSNKRILFNLLPAHVATHFLDNQFRNNMVRTVELSVVLCNYMCRQHFVFFVWKFCDKCDLISLFLLVYIFWKLDVRMLAAQKGGIQKCKHFLTEYSITGTLPSELLEGGCGFRFHYQLP